MNQAMFVGVCVAIGECLFGVYGPFLFDHPHRFGLPDAEAAAIGVLVGTAIGYGVGVAVWWVRHHESVPGHKWFRIAYHPQLGRLH